MQKTQCHTGKTSRPDRSAAASGYDMPCYSPLKGYEDKTTGGICFKKSKNAGKDMEVSCSQCLGCRLDRSRTWAMRIIHEAQMYDDNCFVTLTYSPENLPADGSLNKKHFQKFIKRLRKHFGDRTIRYYHCGEYGDQLDRPHYHACLFNTRFDDSQLYKHANGVRLYTSETLNKIWGLGFTTLGDLTFQSAAYCSRYVLKKVNGKKAHDHYLRCDEHGQAYWLAPEYTTMSLKPGIGEAWFRKYKSDCFPSDEVPVPGKGIIKKVPRYYEEIFKENDPTTYEWIKKQRQKFRKENAHEYTPQRLMAKYKVQKAKSKLLPRTYEND